MKQSRKGRAPQRWSLQDAKNKLSEVVTAAALGQPQVVTRRGVDTAVIIAYDEYERILRNRDREIPSLGDYLLGMPSGPGGFDEVERIPLQVRDADL